MNKGIKREQQNRINEQRFRIILHHIRNRGYVKTSDFGETRQERKKAANFLASFVEHRLLKKPIRTGRCEWRWFPFWAKGE